jgi:collagenase-like PrtC family protease
MKLAVPTNWDEDLLNKINKEEVNEIYGKFEKDFIGGGRASLNLPVVSIKNAKQHIEKIHRRGWEFNYLINSTCLDNWEFTSFGQKKIRRLLDLLVELKVDSVTVAVPFLLKFIKKNYSKFKVYISTSAQVSSPERARQWEDMGADRITLVHQDVNRNFKLLRIIREKAKCRLQLIVNNGCIYNCAFYVYHPVLLSHASQSSHPLKGFFIDYCSLYCRYQQLSNLFNLIRSDWIRPEDIHYYQDLGFDEFKIVDREMSTEKIALIVDSYSKRQYQGNLLNILGIFSSATSQRLDKLIFKKSKYILHPFKANFFKIVKFKKILVDVPIYIENNKLDGFLENFIKEDCNVKVCSECNYCSNIARRVIRIISRENYMKLIRSYQEILSDIESGEMFYANRRQ